MTVEVVAEYWERFEDSFAMEANEFVSSVLDDTNAPLATGTGLDGYEDWSGFKAVGQAGLPDPTTSVRFLLSRSFSFWSRRGEQSCTVMTGESY